MSHDFGRMIYVTSRGIDKEGWVLYELSCCDKQWVKVHDEFCTRTVLLTIGGISHLLN